MSEKVFLKSVDVVVPCYGCPQALPELAARLTATLTGLAQSFKIIMVDDRCPKNSWASITAVAAENPHVKGIRLAKNVGQHNAITAGVTHSTADWVVVMDCDLQDVPEELSKMVAALTEGTKIVFAQRIERKDGYFKQLGSRLFHKFLSYMADTQSDPSIANYSIVHRKVINAFLSYAETTRVYPILIKNLGFKTKYVPIETDVRHSGKSSYSLRRLLKLAADISISFSDKPMWLMIYFGFFVTCFSFLISIVQFARWLINGSGVPGWTSLILSVWFLGGVIMAMLGVLGVYLAKTFDETKRRPLFVVDETVDQQDSRESDK